MSFVFVSLVVGVIYLIYGFCKKKLSFFKDHGIPHIPPVPIFGNMAPVFFGKKHIIDVIKDIYNVNPEAKYVGAYQLFTPTIFVRDLELIKSVTIKNFDNFMDHKTIVDEDLDPLISKNLLQLNGKKWKDVRYVLSPAFTASKMKGMFDVMVNCAENFIKHIDKQAESERKMLDTKDLITRYANDVVVSCGFGISVDSLENPDNEFYVLGREATEFEGSLSKKFMIANAFPKLLKFFRIKLIPDKVTHFFNKIVDATIKIRDEQGITRPDMLQLMMDAREKSVGLSKLTKKEMVGQAFDFFFAGFDLSATQICIICHELAINPEVQKKLQKEIDDVVKNNSGKPTYEEINDMVYMDAVFNESMRLHPQSPFLHRICVKSFEFPPPVPGGKPFIVEPGMDVWIPVVGIHHNPEYYEEPETFNPERFIGKKSSISQVTNLGFGIGPRMCIGNRFAILESKILLFYLLSKYDLLPNEKTCRPLTYSKKNPLSISAEGGFWLGVSPRNK